MILRHICYALACTALCTLPVAVQAGSGSISYAFAYNSQFGGAGSGNGQFNSPEQITMGADGNLYVADRFNHRIQVFDQQGTYISQFGHIGGGNGEFNNVIGVAFGIDGRIIATDAANGRLEFFDPVTYTYTGQFGTNGSGSGQFSYPHLLAVDHNGNIYAADYFNNRIQIFDKDGLYLNEITVMNNPAVVAVDSTGQIYIPNFTLNTISVYDSSYNFVRFLAVSGTGNGQVTNPDGISIDAQDNVYVTEPGNNRIQVFDKNGNFLVAYDNTTSPIGQFYQPRRIYAANDGHVYVVENNNNIDILTLTSTETFSSSPMGGNETAVSPLSNLVLNGSGSFADNFIGYHDVTVSGTDWTLFGTSSFSGDLSLTSGRLTNNGHLTANAFMVDAGTTLAGSGTFTGDVVNNGTVSPGASGGSDIGVMAVNGTYAASPTSILRIDVNAAGQSDKLTVSGAVSLDGELDIVQANGTYAQNTIYTILTAGGGVTGTFASVTDNLAFLDPTLNYSNSNQVTLTLSRNDITALDFVPYAQNGNQNSVANALTAFSASSFGGDTTIFNRVMALSTTEATQLLSQIAPDEVAAMPQVQQNMIRGTQNSLFQRLNAPQSSGTPSFALFSPTQPSGLSPDQVWIQAIGGISNQDNDPGASGYHLNMTGTRIGADKDLSSKTTLGISAAYAHSIVDYKNSSDKSATQYGHFDFYGRHMLADTAFILEGFAGLGGGRIDMTRGMKAGGLNLVAMGDTNAYDVGTALKLSRPQWVFDSELLIPSVTGTASWIRQDGYTESGASPFNLQIGHITATPVTINPMLNWQHPIVSHDSGFKLTPDLGVGATWQLNELDNAVNASFSNATGTPGFTVHGTKQQPLSLNISASVTLEPFSDNVWVPQFQAQANAQTNSSNTNAIGSLTAKWVW